MSFNSKEFKQGNLVRVITDDMKVFEGIFHHNSDSGVELFPLFRQNYDYIGVVLKFNHLQISSIERARFPKGVSEKLRSAYKKHLEIDEIRKKCRELELQCRKLQADKNIKHREAQRLYVYNSKSVTSYLFAKQVVEKVKKELSPEEFKGLFFIDSFKEDDKSYIMMRFRVNLSRYFHKEDYIANEQYGGGNDGLINKYAPSIDTSCFENITKDFKVNKTTVLQDKGSVSVDTTVKMNIKNTKTSDIDLVVKEILKGYEANKYKLKDIEF